MAPLRVGVIGLGRAAALTVPDIARSPQLSLAAVADTNSERARRAAERLGCRSYRSAEALCEDGDIEAVYVATPHECHRAHATLALSAGKHVLVEKPMALTPRDGEEIAAAATAAARVVVVGPGFGSTPSVLAAREIVASGRYGHPRLCEITSYTDFVYRPRRPEELDPATGGGVIPNQMAHQVDILFTLAGARQPESIDAVPGDFDENRRTVGAYVAVLRFPDGFGASLVYSGYGRAGRPSGGRSAARGNSAAVSPAVLRAASADEERRLKEQLAFAADGRQTAPGRSGGAPFARVVLHLERADLVIEGGKLQVVDDDGIATHRLPSDLGAIHRRAISEFCGAVRHGRPAVHDARHGVEVVRACAAAATSAAKGQPVRV